jgi:hypothetical protein
MPWENPGAYDEARNRIRENKERETIIIEEKKENFEKWKEKIRSSKKLDVFGLKRRIETGQSLELLKSDVKEALDRGEISLDTYKNALERIEDLDAAKEKEKHIAIVPEYMFDPKTYPLSNLPITQYFEAQKLWQNLLIDLAWVAYGVAQGSIFLLWLAGRVVLDALLLPVDCYKYFVNKE